MSSLLELLSAGAARMVLVKFRGDLGYCFIQEKQGEKTGLALHASEGWSKSSHGIEFEWWQLSQPVSLNWIFLQPLTVIVRV